jgi:hypothetical protein
MVSLPRLLTEFGSWMISSIRLYHMHLPYISLRIVPDIPCPICLKHGHRGKVKSEGWNQNGLRRVANLHQHYYIICRRHKCENAIHHEHPHTFLSYDPEVVAAMPKFIQNQMPAIITRRSAFDKKALTVIEFLATNGVGFQTMERLLSSMNHGQKYELERLYMQHVDASNALCERQPSNPSSQVSRMHIYVCLSIP